MKINDHEKKKELNFMKINDHEIKIEFYED